MSTNVYGLLCVFFMVQITASLVCYQTDEKTGEVTKVDDDSFVYCRYFPGKESDQPQEAKKEFMDGITQADVGDEPFGQLFDESDQFYEVLSVCLYEKYDLQKFLRRSPKFNMSPKMKIEYQFRCICNYDLCNHWSTFSSYFVKF